MSNLKNGHRDRLLKGQHRQQCRSARRPCVHCGQPIDYSAPAGSRNSFESDHRMPVSTHPHLAYSIGNLQPSHMSCNRSRQARPMIDARAEWIPAQW
jgi:5-methylcytosine-specific restriction endonuclease McrA